MEIYVAGAKQESPKQLRAISTKALDTEGIVRSYFNQMPQLTKKYHQFWDLMEVIEEHGYLRASISAVGRGAVGAWWTISEHPLFMGKGKEEDRNRLYDFYSSKNRLWDNIKDFQSMTYKISAAAMYLKYFGQAAFYIVRDKRGRPIGLDFLHGLVVPNVDQNGYFKTPAFYQFSEREALKKQEFAVNEVVFITNPDLRGDPMGGSDTESLTTFSLPTDIYLMATARNYIQNRDVPEAVWELPENISDDALNDFADLLARKYRGSPNVGKSPVVVAGELNIKELRRMPEDLPYAESRKESRDEIIATSGSSSVKLGLSDNQSQSNLLEFRREFLEGTLVPLFKPIELALYEQVHLREFGISEWEFAFNHPDFLTAVEQATVHMRYHDMGVMNPNEIRADLGRAPRPDEGGEEYLDGKASNDQGTPPEGQDTQPDDGEPNIDDQDPPRGDGHDDANRPRALSPSLDKKAAIEELFTWRDFAVNRTKKGNLRQFNPEHIPTEIANMINKYLLSQDRTIEEVKSYFNDAIDILKE